MIFSQLTLLVLLTSSLVYSSVPMENRKQIICASSSNNICINDLDEFLILLIGKFLYCPQKEFGFLNRFYSNLFLERHPFRELVAERHGIHELKQSTSDNDLAIFSQFALTADKNHLYNLIFAHLIVKDSFSENKPFISLYLLRMERLSHSCSYSSSLLKVLNRFIVRTFLDYNFVIEYFIINANAFIFFCSTGRYIKVGKAYMQRVLSIEEAFYRRIEGFLGNDVQFMTEFDQEKASRNVYNRLVKHINSSPSNEDHGKFLSISILAGVPHEWYFPWIFILNPDFRNSVLMYVLHLNEFIVSLEDNVSIFYGMYRILNEIVEPNTVKVRHFKLLNHIRFGNEVDYHFVLTEMIALKDRPNLFYDVVASSVLGRSYELLQLLKYTFPAEEWEKVNSELLLSDHGMRVFFALLEIYSEDEKENLFDELSGFAFILEYYNLGHVSYEQETSRATFTYVLMPELVDEGLPLAFEIFMILSSESTYNTNELLSEIVSSIFNQKTERDEVSLVRLMDAYNLISSFEPDPYTVTYHASSSFLKSVAKSERLVGMIKSMDLQFSFINEMEFANLLETGDISNLRGILVDFDISEALYHIKSFKQIRNLEVFLNQDIAEITITHVIPHIQCTENNYFKLSTALRYWLKSPQRHRMSELKEKGGLLLQLLKKEVDLEDAEFIENL